MTRCFILFAATVVAPLAAAQHPHRCTWDQNRRKCRPEQQRPHPKQRAADPVAGEQLWRRGSDGKVHRLPTPPPRESLRSPIALRCQRAAMQASSDSVPLHGNAALGRAISRIHVLVSNETTYDSFLLHSLLPFFVIYKRFMDEGGNPTLSDVTIWQGGSFGAFTPIFEAIFGVRVSLLPCPCAESGDGKSLCTLLTPDIRGAADQSGRSARLDQVRAMALHPEYYDEAIRFVERRALLSRSVAALLSKKASGGNRGSLGGTDSRGVLLLAIPDQRNVTSSFHGELRSALERRFDRRRKRSGSTASYLLGSQSSRVSLRVLSVRLADLSFPEQIRAFRAAQVIVAQHGALANIVFCRPSALVVELCPSRQHQQTFRALATHRRLLYGFVELESGCSLLSRNQPPYSSQIDVGSVVAAVEQYFEGGYQWEGRNGGGI